MSLQEISLYETAEQLGLTRDETDEIFKRLGRAPTQTELAMISVEWSEHCSYRRSRRHFGRFPRQGKVPVLVGEDAGGIVLEDLAVLFKVESHNHPSQVEPKHGAATGVGGIIRDIVALGARPMALLNSLRFGPLSQKPSRALLAGAVDGIQWYGNCIGVPTVGGEIDFHEAYAGNCLVNVMCVGVAPKDSLLTSKARPGYAVMLLGSRTGRDGIGGCSVLASQEMRQSLEKRPTVQIGDPYFGKCLIEATLEAAALGLLVALKDMGAAGLTCTTSEMSAAGGCGMEVEVTRIPAREENMLPWEFMMSESQERMLAVVEPENTEKVREIFHRWGLEAEVIGTTVPDPAVKIMAGGRLVASLPTHVLVDPPPVSPEAQASAPQKEAYKLPAHLNLNDLLPKFLASPSLASKKWVWRQYDHMVGTNTMVGPGNDAALLRVKGKPWALAVTMEGNGRYCAADPNVGAQYVVAEGARNLIAMGAHPLAITDGLNFGNPDKPEAYGEFLQVVEGLAHACRELNLPVVSGNVSFYNEHESGRILPTPILGLVGQCPDPEAVLLHQISEGDRVYLVGPSSSDLSGSLFLEFLNVKSHGLAPLDWKLEKNVHEACLALHAGRLLTACHDVGQGGLLVALMELLASGRLGATVTRAFGIEELFSEAPSRFLVTTALENVPKLEKLLQDRQTPYTFLGEIGGSRLMWGEGVEFSLDRLVDILENTLDRIMGD